MPQGIWQHYVLSMSSKSPFPLGIKFQLLSTSFFLQFWQSTFIAARVPSLSSNSRLQFLPLWMVYNTFHLNYKHLNPIETSATGHHKASSALGMCWPFCLSQCVSSKLKNGLPIIVQDWAVADLEGFNPFWYKSSILLIQQTELLGCVEGWHRLEGWKALNHCPQSSAIWMITFDCR